MLNFAAKSRARRETARRILEALTARARARDFFERFAVPDTIDGRFDLVVLHAFLVLERLDALKERDLSQSLVDMLFISFDEGLRDLGVGDIGMGRRLKAMGNAFYGRLDVYGRAHDLHELAAALQRNLYRGRDGTNTCAAAIARYMEQARQALAGADLRVGACAFGPLPSQEGLS